MQLTVITPEGVELTFAIEDWKAINENGELTELALLALEYKPNKMLQHTLEYHSIKTRLSLDGCVIVSKPESLTCTPDYIRLDFSK